MLEANNGNTETAVEALTNEDSADALLAQSLSEKEAGPSSSVQNIGKSNSALKSNLSSSKGIFF